LFSLVDGVLVRPLAYPEPERLVRIDGLSGSGDVLPLSRPDWRDWTEAQSSFVGIASHLPVTLESVLGGREPARLRVRRVSWNFFAVLGVPPERGRWFNSDEEGTGAPPLAIMSYGAHTRLFGEAADTATRVLDLLGEPHTVVGVMPRDFQYIEPTDVWILHEREEIWEVRAWPTFGTAGRLRSGVSLAQAAAEMDAIARAGREAHGDMTMARRARLTALQEWVVGGTRRTHDTVRSSGLRAAGCLREPDQWSHGARHGAHQ
jgi:hypothetical protein